GRSSTAVDVFPATLLAALDPRLAERARIALVPTRNALPTARTQEDRGLVIHSAAPVYDASGRLVAVLEGGVLLNQNLDFVDRINALVYPDGSLISGSRGTATLFLGDVRIATNVRLEGDARAIGTRLSEVVRQATLGQGQTWLDRAFVVSDWFVSGYQPIFDSFGNRAGLLYIGFLEAPYQALKRESLIVVAVLCGFAILLATVLSLRGAASIFRPVERMKATMQAVEEGQLDARVGALGRNDEIGRLAGHFDHLLDELERRNEVLTEWGLQLDAKVDTRTRELADANRSLAAANHSLVIAQRQLVMSEKLAAIGELTAGMAHEINNPMAVMQGNLDLIRELLGPRANAVGNEFRLLDEQIERVRLIVSRLLQFARPSDYSGEVAPLEIAPLFADSLVLVGHLLKRGNIAVRQHIATRRAVLGNRNEMQQVLINLLVNAIQAMPDGGTLDLEGEDWDVADHPAGVKLTVRDTGPGIALDQQERIFDPFYTTKRGIGTGLGLPISLSLLHRYGGRITVASQPGAGAAFSMWLPLEPLENHESAAPG
ncbi:MAG TPA: cache domain-containing protein, partial [Rhodocyclaceae bacterium]|nr:cache domain-containing protein [Rhodocyclaceae bacterium]